KKRYLHSFPTRRSSDLINKLDNEINPEKREQVVQTEFFDNENQSNDDDNDDEEYENEEVNEDKNINEQQYFDNQVVDNNITNQSDRKSTRLNSSHVKIS